MPRSDPGVHEMTDQKRLLAKESRRTFIGQTIASLSASALAGCGNGSTTSTATAPAASSSPSNPSFVVTPTTMASIVSRPATFLTEYRALGGGSNSTAASTIRSALGPAFTTLSDTGAMAVYASLIASHAAPIGDPGIPPMDASLSQLLQANVLSCGHYCKLATLLAFLGRATLSPPNLSSQANSPPATMHFLVWLSTVPINTGYHSQLVISNALNDAYLLLDPMYGFALAIPFAPSGPQSNLTDIENAATFLMQPLSTQTLVQFNPAGLQSNPTVAQMMISGALGPQDIYHDSIYGSEGWDTRIAQIVGNLS